MGFYDRQKDLHGRNVNAVSRMPLGEVFPYRDISPVRTAAKRRRLLAAAKWIGEHPPRGGSSIKRAGGKVGGRIRPTVIITELNADTRCPFCGRTHGGVF